MAWYVWAALAWVFVALLTWAFFHGAAVMRGRHFEKGRKNVRGR
jgi:hypothetical protein